MQHGSRVINVCNFNIIIDTGGGFELDPSCDVSSVYDVIVMHVEQGGQL